MAEGKEVRRKCVHCGKRFAVMRYGRESLSRICPRCTDALKRERVAQQAALERMTPAQKRQQCQPGEPSPARVHSVRAKPVSQRFAPKGERAGFVWWDRNARMYRGIVQQLPEGWVALWRSFEDLRDQPVIHEAWATSIPDLVQRMSRYADVDQQVQQALLNDTPPTLRVGVSQATGDSASAQQAET